jgi:hypothetical protein
MKIIEDLAEYEPVMFMCVQVNDYKKQEHQQHVLVIKKSLFGCHSGYVFRIVRW